MNQEYPSTLLERAVKEFTKLPGIGRKTATRLVLHLLRKKEEDLALAVKYFDFMWDMYCNPDSDPFKITPKENAEVRSLHSNANPMVLVSSAQTILRTTTDGLARQEDTTSE